jgi:four helix bundle protein
MCNEVRSFEDLECWKAARELRIFVARSVVPSLPLCEKYRLGDQLLRAARSTTANIAEGHGRYHFLDKRKFCSNARGSCSEVLDHLITGNDEGLLPAGHLVTGRRLVAHATKLINGYIAYLRRAGGAADA